MIKIFGYIFLLLAAIGFVVYLFNFVRRILFLHKLNKKTKLDLLPYTFGPLRGCCFGITADSKNDVYSSGKNRLLTDLQLAMIENYKPGGIWYDEEKIPRHISNYSLTPGHFVSFSYDTGRFSSIFENKESIKVDELEFFYNELALLKRWKFGSGCYFIDEQRPSSSEDKQ